jgi:hypothetical protein
MAPSDLILIGSLEIPTQAVNSLDILSALRCAKPSRIIVAMRMTPGASGCLSPAIQAVGELRVYGMDGASVDVLDQSFWDRGLRDEGMAGVEEEARQRIDACLKEGGADVKLRGEYASYQMARTIYRDVFEASLKVQNSESIRLRLRAVQSVGRATLIRLARGLGESAIAAALDRLARAEEERRERLGKALIASLIVKAVHPVAVLCDLAMKPFLHETLAGTSSGGRWRLREYWE